MNRDKVKVILFDAIETAFEEDELQEGRDGYIGDETINLMAEAALNVLLAVEEVQNYLDREVNV